MDHDLEDPRAQVVLQRHLTAGQTDHGNRLVGGRRLQEADEHVA